MFGKRKRQRTLEKSLKGEPRSLTNEDIESFEDSVAERRIRPTLNLTERLRAYDPARLWMLRSDLRWLKARCDDFGIPYEEVMWWRM